MFTFFRALLSPVGVSKEGALVLFVIDLLVLCALSLLLGLYGSWAQVFLGFVVVCVLTICAQRYDKWQAQKHKEWVASGRVGVFPRAWMSDAHTCAELFGLPALYPVCMILGKMLAWLWSVL